MSKNCFWTTDCGNGLQTFSFIVKGQRTKVESFFLTTDFLRLQVHETTSFLALTQEPELQNYGTASSDKSLKSKVKTATTPNHYPASTNRQPPFLWSC